MTPANDPHIREPGGLEWVTPAPPPPNVDDDLAPGRPPVADDFGPGHPLRSSAGRADDERYLQLLSVFHFVVGGLMALCAMTPIVHFAFGIGLVTGSFPAAKGSGPPPPPALGWMFVLGAGAIMAFGWAVAISLFLAGYFLRRRRHYVFCLVTAGLACTFQPFGIMLGVFTFIVLLRPSVKQLFGRTPRTPALA
jgi:hypothetical protein